MQAIRRNIRFLDGKIPHILFLHGNSAIGYCRNDKLVGYIDGVCGNCRQALIPAPLLYPIKEKNYTANEFIDSHWRTFELALSKAFMITIFGYSAPDTDTEAIKLMKKAWGEVEKRNMEQTEIIARPGFDEDKLVETWEPFIHSHHYKIVDNFYGSWISKHPRRTGEAYWNQFLEAKFISNNPIPKELDFPDLWNWYSKLIEVENAK